MRISPVTLHRQHDSHVYPDVVVRGSNKEEEGRVPCFEISTCSSTCSHAAATTTTQYAEPLRRHCLAWTTTTTLDDNNNDTRRRRPVLFSLFFYSLLEVRQRGAVACQVRRRRYHWFVRDFSCFVLADRRCALCSSRDFIKGNSAYLGCDGHFAWSARNTA